MFLIRFIQYLFGYIKFCADGGNPEKFLNLAARAGITLWNLRRHGTAICGCVLTRAFPELEKDARKAGVSLRVISRSGLPVKLNKYRGRMGFIVGAAFFFAILWYFSGFIWEINITGNSRVQTREISYELKQLGLYPGVQKGTLDLHYVAQQAVLQLPSLSFMHINLDGGTATVEVGERTLAPEVIPANVPCNVISSETGQIIRLETTQGLAKIKDGDTITKGGLLISGVILEPKSKVTRLVHASGKAIALTKHQLSVTLPYKEKQEQNTGEVKTCRNICFLGLKIPLYFAHPQGMYRRQIYKKPIIICSMALPFREDVTVYTGYRLISVKLTKAQAAAEARAKLAQSEKIELYGDKIKKKSYKEQPNASTFTLTGQYECEEDIAIQQEITIS